MVNVLTRTFSLVVGQRIQASFFVISSEKNRLHELILALHKLRLEVLGNPAFMSNRPEVSICIPCYNGAEFLQRTIQSVLGQSFTNFEVILADDKSTDCTMEILRGFTDARISLVQNDRNLGLVPNWYNVLSRSRGDYVKLLCEDDLLHPECLARQLEVLKEPKNCGIVLTACRRTVINSRDKVLLRSSFRRSAGHVSGRVLIRNSVRTGSNIIGEPAAVLFRRSAFSGDYEREANPYMADLTLWAQLLRCGDAYLDDSYLAAFRISSNAATSRIGLRQAAAFCSFIKTLRRDRFYTLGFTDAILGRVRAVQWCVLRNIFTKAHYLAAAANQGSSLSHAFEPARAIDF
jgi:glycosyltransferase involved in cell wall biosynthesis